MRIENVTVDNSYVRIRIKNVTVNKSYVLFPVTTVFVFLKPLRATSYKETMSSRTLIIMSSNNPII